ncbi:primosomal protein [Cellulomonas chengniuliangii]|uniref:Primosomal protein n=1 Tax=Cellulomonas chengniuliangii TaxID=2968084 RepID=A0ABY5L4G6_9CELL|nr:primosomal protein [Cellulomonas chengniuliangii]MCC2308162.1 primosomal protein [Cellulomonas chengniuliangii]UUI76556.1 primosomal protein [Cellulomonas chengniuliangii]
MTADPRAALDRLIAALEAHYLALATRRGEDDPAVDDAYDILADAFEVYDDALATVYGEATPFELADDDDDDDDDEDDEDEDDESFGGARSDVHVTDDDEDDYDDLDLIDGPRSQES